MKRLANDILPVWAPRIRKSQITKLYNSTTKGYLDEDIINDVGFSILERCISMLKVTEIIRGGPRCIKCRETIKVKYSVTKTLKCRQCGWSFSWDAYKKTYQRKKLFAGGIESYIKDFIYGFKKSQSPNERLILIDTLIHVFHCGSSH